MSGPHARAMRKQAQIGFPQCVTHRHSFTRVLFEKTSSSSPASRPSSTRIRSRARDERPDAFVPRPPSSRDTRDRHHFISTFATDDSSASLRRPQPHRDAMRRAGRQRETPTVRVPVIDDDESRTRAPRASFASSSSSRRATFKTRVVTRFSILDSSGRAHRSYRGARLHSFHFISFHCIAFYP